VLRIIAVTFFVLAAYVLIGSAIDLAAQAHPERSPVGIGLTVASLLVMPLLGWRKGRVGSALRNPLVLADAAETMLCATLAATTLLGLALFAAFGWWWADPVAALAVAWFAVREGREAWLTRRTHSAALRLPLGRARVPKTGEQCQRLQRRYRP